MSLIRTAAVALALAFAVTAGTAPADAFFFHKKGKVASAKYTDPFTAFFKTIFHIKN